jgi:hypothetical protein
MSESESGARWKVRSAGDCACGAVNLEEGNGGDGEEVNLLIFSSRNGRLVRGLHGRAIGECRVLGAARLQGYFRRCIK